MGDLVLLLQWKTFGSGPLRDFLVSATNATQSKAVFLQSGILSPITY